MDDNDEIKTHSPIPSLKPEVQTMSFPESMQAVLVGRRITRLSWNDNKEYGLMKDGWLMIHTRGEYFTWNVSDGDMLADDWVVLPEVN